MFFFPEILRTVNIFYLTFHFPWRISPNLMWQPLLSAVSELSQNSPTCISEPGLDSVVTLWGDTVTQQASSVREEKLSVDVWIFVCVKTAVWFQDIKTEPIRNQCWEIVRGDAIMTVDFPSQSANATFILRKLDYVMLYLIIKMWNYLMFDPSLTQKNLLVSLHGCVDVLFMCGGLLE